MTKAMKSFWTVVLPLVLVSSAAAANVLERVSVDSSGNQGDLDSRVELADWAASADGAYVVFESSSTNLVPGDNNGVADVFIRDMVNGTTSRVSVDSSGGDANGDSLNPSISADGRYVAFDSAASDLVAGDGNSEIDVFVRDLQLGQTVRVSVDMGGGDANGESRTPSLSGDGRSVVFHSFATDLVSGDGNGFFDIFHRDLDLDQTIRLSVDAAGGDSDGDSWVPTISSDGLFVGFSSVATDLVATDDNGFADVFVRDLDANTTTLISLDSAGNGSNEGSFDPSLSGDGRYVAFWSHASDLVTGDTNDSDDVFVWDRISGTNQRVSVTASGAQAETDSSWYPSLSTDGRFLSFQSAASDLVAGDDNGFPDIFARVLETGALIRVSVHENGAQGNEHSQYSAITGGGEFVIFDSEATTLVDNDTNGSWDVFFAQGPLVIFADGFESGDLSAWSASQP